MSQSRGPNWAALAIFVAVLAIVVPVILYWHSLKREEAALVGPASAPDTRGNGRTYDPVPERQNIPWGENAPTAVSVFNEGTNEALIQQVIFHDWKRIPTPKRFARAGKGPTIPINFTHEHYDREERQFIFLLRDAPAAPGKQWTTLEIAIVEPLWVGHTYVGKLTVVFDGSKQYTASGVVELDVLARTPSM